MWPVHTVLYFIVWKAKFTKAPAANHSTSVANTQEAEPVNDDDDEDDDDDKTCVEWAADSTTSSSWQSLVTVLLTF